MQKKKKNCICSTVFVNNVLSFILILMGEKVRVIFITVLKEFVVAFFITVKRIMNENLPHESHVTVEKNHNSPKIGFIIFT